MSAATNPRASKEHNPRSGLPRERGASVPLDSQPVDAPPSFKPIGVFADRVLASLSTRHDVSLLTAAHRAASQRKA